MDKKDREIKILETTKIYKKNMINSYLYIRT